MKKVLSVFLCICLLTSLSISAMAITEYDIFVDGVQVTSYNSDDVLGNSSVSYDRQTNTLVLSDASIKGYHIFGDNAAAIFSANDLNIELKGDNTACYSADDMGSEVSCYGIYSDKSLHFYGDGKLNVSAQSYGIYAYTGLEFNGCSVEAKAYYFAVYSVDNELKIVDSSISAIASNKSGYGIGNFYGDIIINNSSVFAVANFGIVAQKGGKIQIMNSRVICSGNNRAMYFLDGCLSVGTTLNKRMQIYFSADKLGIFTARLYSSNYDRLSKNYSRYVYIDSHTTNGIASLFAKMTSVLRVIKAVKA